MTKSILQMDPTPNFGVFSDFIHPFLTEVDFSFEFFWNLIFDYEEMVCVILQYLVKSFNNKISNQNLSKHVSTYFPILVCGVMDI